LALITRLYTEARSTKHEIEHVLFAKDRMSKPKDALRVTLELTRSLFKFTLQDTEFFEVKIEIKKNFAREVKIKSEKQCGNVCYV